MWQLKENDNEILTDCYYLDDCADYLDVLIEELLYSGYRVQLSDDRCKVYVDGRLVYRIEQYVDDGLDDTTRDTFVYDESGHHIDVSSTGEQYAYE